VREPIGFAFVKRAHFKGHFHLRDLLNRKRGIFEIIRMFNGIFEVFLELKIRNIERFKIVVEIKARKDYLRASDGSLFILPFLDLLFNLDLLLLNSESQFLDFHHYLLVFGF
jgi:hypothetical protein